MILWRLADPRFATDLSGNGAKLVGGRWNAPGQAALYTSQHLSLAVLETLVHLPPQLRGGDIARMALRLTLPDALAVRKVDHLPKALSGARLLQWCRALGSEWLGANAEPVLQVPSVVVPEEMNFVLNPNHPALRDLKITAKRTFKLDERL